MLYCGSDYPPLQTYKSYKGKMFEKKKQKMLKLMKSIKDTSLKPEDQKLLYKELIKIAEQFNPNQSKEV